MKTINITGIELEEIIIRPNDGEIKMSVSYRLKDGLKMVFTKRIVVNISDLPLQAQTVVNDLVAKVKNKIENLENI